MPEEEDVVPMERLKITNLDKWGKLVKRWARRELKWPTTPEQLKDQCVDAGCVADVPKYVDKVEMVQRPVTTLLLRLPPQELLDNSEKLLKKDGFTYTIPDFYNDLYKRDGDEESPKPTVPKDTDGKMTLHALRIGDYTMSNCV